MEKRQIWFLFLKEKSPGFLFRVEAAANNGRKGASTANGNGRNGVLAANGNRRKGASVANGIVTIEVGTKVRKTWDANSNVYLLAIKIKE